MLLTLFLASFVSLPQHDQPDSGKCSRDWKVQASGREENNFAPHQTIFIEPRQIAIQYVVVRMPHRLLPKLGYQDESDFQLKYLRESEVAKFMQEANTCATVNVTQTPKLTLFDGQTSEMSFPGDLPLTATCDYLQVNGKVVVKAAQSDQKALSLRTTANLCVAENQVDLGILAEHKHVPNPAVPTLYTNRIECKVRLEDGQTVVLSHFPYQSPDRNMLFGGIPILQDLPLVGALFQGKVNPEPADTMVILATARIVEEDDAP
jgi:hypothetical protein